MVGRYLPGFRRGYGRKADDGRISTLHRILDTVYALW